MMRTLTLLAACGFAGCVDEHDVDVFLVLPQIRNVCTLAGVARADLDVTGPGPESCHVRSETCGPIGDATYDCFQDAPDGPLRLERLAGGFFQLTVTLSDADGTFRGRRKLPLDSRSSPLIIPMDRADLSGWQTLLARVDVPTCAEAADLASVGLTLTPAGAARPLPDVTIDCARPQAMVTVPFGPLSAAANGRLSSGAVCYQVTIDAVVDPDHERVNLPLTRTCP
jgi:hypothetical protein